jgi:hypothetical protein
MIAERWHQNLYQYIAEIYMAQRSLAMAETAKRRKLVQFRRRAKRGSTRTSEYPLGS